MGDGESWILYLGWFGRPVVLVSLRFALRSSSTRRTTLG